MKHRKERFPGEQRIFFKQTEGLLCDINRAVDFCAARGGVVRRSWRSPQDAAAAWTSGGAEREQSHTRPGELRGKARRSAALVSIVSAVLLS